MVRKEAGVGRNQKLTGEITKIDFDHGFGFLIDEDGMERFFHASMLGMGDDGEALEIGGLAVGDKVSFTPIMSAKGARAANITLKQRVED